MAFSDWSTTAGSNTSVGGVSIAEGMNPSDVNNAIRAVMAEGRAALGTKGADIASATTTDLGAVAGLFHDITGTTTITSFGTISAGIWKVIKFEGVLTLTHNATSLILPGGANITTANGDVAIVVSEGSGNWRCESYLKASGLPIALATSGTKQDSTSGTEIDFTGIPAGVKRIEMMLAGVSTNGTSLLQIQLGDSGGVETSGYLGSADTQASGGGTSTTSTSGLSLGRTSDASYVVHGIATFVLLDSAANQWVGTWVGSASNTGLIMWGSTSKSLSGTLDRIRLTTVNGTDAFDAGTVNIVYQ